MAQQEHGVNFVISAQNRARSAFDEITRSLTDIGGASSRLQATLGGLGIGLSVAGLVAFVKGGIDAAAALDDLSEKTGASVEELSKLQQVARIGGHDFGIVESFLIKLNKALHETDEEAKGANRALEALGLSAKDLRELDPGQAIRVVAEAMSKFADGGGKTAAILALTGRNAAEALPFLKDLATETGIVTRVTAEQAAKAEELQKSIKRLGNEASNASTAFAQEFVPGLTRISVAVNEAYRDSGKLMALWVALGGVAANVLGFDATQQAAKQTADRLKEIGEQLSVARKQLEAGSLKPPGASDSLFGFLVPNVKLGEDALKKIRGTIDSLEKERARLLAATQPKPGEETKPVLGFEPPKPKPAAGPEDKTFENARKRLEDLAIKTQDLTQTEEELAAIEAGRYRTLTDEQRKEILRLAAIADIKKADTKAQQEADKANEEAFKQSAARGKEENDRLDRLREQYIELIDPTEKYRKKLEEIQLLAEKGLITPEQSDAAAFAIEKQVNALSSMGDEIKKNDELASQLGLTFSSAFEEAVIGGKKFSDVLKGLYQDVERILLRKTVTEPLAAAVSGAVKGFDIGDIFKGLFGFGGGKAQGGPLDPGKWYMAGERGPEPIWGGGPGAFAMGGAGAGNNVSFTQVINFSANTPEAVRAAVSAMAPALVQASVRGVREADARGR